MHTAPALQSQLLEIIRTKNEALYLSENLEKLRESIYNAKTNPDKEIEKHIPYGQKEQFTKLLQQNGIDITNLEKTQEFILLVEKTIKEFPVLSLTLAFEPSREIIDNISDWVQRETGKNLLIDIILDKKVVAGAIMKHNGLYKDFSLRKKIEEKYGVIN